MYLTTTSIMKPTAEEVVKVPQQIVLDDPALGLRNGVGAVTILSRGVMQDTGTPVDLASGQVTAFRLEDAMGTAVAYSVDGEEKTIPFAEVLRIICGAVEMAYRGEFAPPVAPAEAVETETDEIAGAEAAE